MPKWTEKLWERQRGESAQAYEAFDLYLKMGTERSCRRVAQELSKSDTIIRRWSSAWSWQKRVWAYDNELEKEAWKRAVAEHKAMFERHIEVALQLQDKALKALDNLSTEEMTAKDIKECLKTATDLERLSRALTEAKTEAGNSDHLADCIFAAYHRRRETVEN